MLLKLFFVLMACLIASALQSCAQVDVKKMTYKALRQHDCRTNEPNAFCERGFSNEFEAYVRMRQQFLRNGHTVNEQASLTSLNLNTLDYLQ